MERWVPCGGYNDLEEKLCGNEFRLDQLELWLEKRPERDRFNCPECDKDHSRLVLVEGIGSETLTQPLTEKRAIELLKSFHTGTRAYVKRHLKEQIEELIKYQERNFLRQFKLQQNIELVSCPNLFTIREIPRNGLTVKSEWKIQLYCQEPGAWHRVGDPYIIKEQREIIGKMLPYLKTLLKVLQFIGPLAGAALAMTDAVGDVDIATRTLADGVKKDFGNEVVMMEKFVKVTAQLPNVVVDEDGDMMRSHPKRREFAPIGGVDLAPVRKLMDVLAQQDMDAGNPKWQGLQRIFTPEGDILWLDQEHARVYESKREKPES